MRIFVTGGAGFIGSHTVETLLGNGLEVTVFDNLSSGSRENLPSETRFFEGDVRDHEALLQGMEGCQAVLHLAALVSVPESIRFPQFAHAVNATGTLNVLEAAREHGIARVVMASSAAVYGENSDLPLREEAQLSSLSPYAAQKRLGEVYAGIYAQLHGMSPIALRYFNVYGPRQNPASPYSGVLSRFIRASVSGELVTVFGDGQQTRDFVYVKDVAQANMKALLAEAKGSHILNVGTGLATPVLGAYEVIQRQVGASLHPDFAPPRAGDIRHSCASIEKARQLLGYDPVHSFEEGILHTVRWSQTLC